MTPKVGDFVSIWNRDSRRHKWKMEYGFVLLTRLEGDDISFQTSRSHNHYENSGWHTALLRGHGPWERELREPMFDITPNARNLKKSTQG